MTCIRGVEATLERARKSLGQEFEQGRADRAEIVALNALLEQTGQDLSAAWAREGELQSRLNATDAALAEARAQRLEMETLANARLAENGRLSGDLQSVRGEAGELRASLEQATGRVQRLEEDNIRLRAKVEELELRRQEAESQGIAAIQAKGLLEVEHGVLERRVESLNGELSRSTRTIADLEAQLSAEKAKGRGLETAAQNAAAEIERINRLSDEAAHHAKAEIETAELRLQTAQARAARVEEENAEFVSKLAEATARDRAAEREVGELKLRLERSEEQISRLSADLIAARQERAGVEAARTAAVERADRMAELAQSREAEVGRLDEQVDVLQSRIAALEADIMKEKMAAAERVKALSASVERERSERSVVTGALEAARKGRARLHLEMLKVNRGRPVALEAADEASEDAPKAANVEAL